MFHPIRLSNLGFVVLCPWEETWGISVSILTLFFIITCVACMVSFLLYLSILHLLSSILTEILRLDLGLLNYSFSPDLVLHGAAVTCEPLWWPFKSFMYVKSNDGRHFCTFDFFATFVLWFLSVTEIFTAPFFLSLCFTFLQVSKHFQQFYFGNQRPHTFSASVSTDTVALLKTSLYFDH